MLLLKPRLVLGVITHLRFGDSAPRFSVQVLALSLDSLRKEQKMPSDIFMHRSICSNAI